MNLTRIIDRDPVLGLCVGFGLVGLVVIIIVAIVTNPKDKNIPLVASDRVCFARIVPEVTGLDGEGYETKRAAHLAFMGTDGRMQVEFLPPSTRTDEISALLTQKARAGFCQVVILKPEGGI